MPYLYCEANRSDQKAKVEKNHEYIRYIIPKGTSMDNYTQDKINLMMSHINSVAREILNFAIPYDMASIYLGVFYISSISHFLQKLEFSLGFFTGIYFCT